MTVTRSIAVVSAGLSQPSSTRLLADRLTEGTVRHLAGQGVEARPVVVDLRDHAHQVTDAMLTGFAPSGLREVVEAVTGADGLIAVTPIFNASYSGLFKSFFDVLDDQALAGKPVLLGATGGTARHSLALEHALRPMFVYLHADVVGTSVFAATDDWAAADGQDGVGALPRRIDRAARELADQVARREPSAPADPFELTTDFAALLGSQR